VRPEVPEAASTPMANPGDRQQGRTAVTVKICICCDKSIKDDEACTKVDKMSPSGAGSTLYQHARRCRPVPVETNQASLRR
jgi:hypothetical protein